MTTFTFDETPVFSVPEGSCPREILSHLLNTRHAPDDDPFFAIDLGLLPQLVDLWRQLFPSVRPFYAVKCNPDPLMISLLARLGVGFDCASKGEIRTVSDLLSSLELSATESIIYANPCKQLSHIQYSKLKGVNLATFDNSGELHKHALHHSSCDLVIRIAVDDSSSLCKLSNKYGCPLSSAADLLQLADQLSLSVVGVSFHVGSDCLDGDLFKKAIKDAREVFDVALSYGYQFSLLDIGGGFPSCLGSKPSLSFMQSLSATINTSIAANFSDWTGLRVIAEPGRFFASACHLLAVTVTSSRSCVPSPDNDNTEVMYYVNEGVYGVFNCILFDHQTPKPHLLSPNKSPALRSSLWGPSCDGLDQILKETLLPPLQLGDWLYFEEMGAYTRASRSDFNGFSAPLNYYYVTTNQRSRLCSLLVPTSVPLCVPNKELDRKQTDLSHPLRAEDIGLIVSAIM